MYSPDYVMWSGSPPSTSTGASTMSNSRKETNGRWPSPQTKDSLSHSSCSSDYATHLLPSRWWWMTSSIPSLITSHLLHGWHSHLLCLPHRPSESHPRDTPDPDSNPVIIALWTCKLPQHPQWLSCVFITCYFKSHVFVDIIIKPNHLLQKDKCNTSLRQLEQFCSGSVSEIAEPVLNSISILSAPSKVSDKAMNNGAGRSRPPSVQEIREASEKDWNKHACIFQAEIAHFLLQHPKQNLVATTATGIGKTFTFFLPAWYENGVTFIIVPLKKLGEQHCESASHLGFLAINIEAKTLNDRVIWVCCNKNQI